MLVPRDAVHAAALPACRPRARRLEPRRCSLIGD